MTLYQNLGLTAFLLVCALWMVVIYGFATMCRCRRNEQCPVCGGPEHADGICQAHEADEIMDEFWREPESVYLEGRDE